MDLYQHGAATHVGLYRKRNEDAYLVKKEQPVKIFAVADGLGGHSGGDVASQLTLKVIEASKYNTSLLKENIKDAVEKANEQVLETASANPQLQGMGTTLTMVALYKDYGVIAHVGDSRAYLYRQGKLSQLTEDHTLVGELLRQGRLDPQEAMKHPKRHVLLQAIGLEPRLDIDIHEIYLRDGDNLLICTDGLTGLIREEELANILAEEGQLQQKAERFIEETNARGGFDNTTVLLVSYRVGEG